MQALRRPDCLLDSLPMIKSTPPNQGGLTAAQYAQRAAGPAPTLLRRMAAFIYEGVVLFGVVMTVGGIYSVSTNQTHGLHGRQGLQAVLFLTLALYFIWFWTHGGQTLAMRSWQLRLVNTEGQAVSLRQALTRFLLSWLWFVPALGAAWLAGWHQSKLLYGAMLVWACTYALLSFLHPQRQFWHDAVCGTRVIDNRS